MLKKYLYKFTLEENKVLTIYATSKEKADKILDAYIKRTSKPNVLFLDKKAINLYDEFNFKELNEKYGHELSDKEIEEFQLDMAKKSQIFKKE